MQPSRWRTCYQRTPEFCTGRICGGVDSIYYDPWRLWVISETDSTSLPNRPVLQFRTVILPVGHLTRSVMVERRTNRRLKITVKVGMDIFRQTTGMMSLVVSVVVPVVLVAQDRRIFLEIAISLEAFLRSRMMTQIRNVRVVIPPLSVSVSS